MSRARAGRARRCASACRRSASSLAVLGSIVGGIAAPTEAASMGALGSIVVVVLSGRFSWCVLRETTLATTRITAGMMFMLICAQVFALAFRGLHGEQLVPDLFEVVPGGIKRYLVFMLLLIFVLGFFIEWIEISYIVVPLFLPMLLNLERRSGVGRDADRRQPADVVPDAAVRLGAVLSAQRRAARSADVAIYKGVVPFIGLQLITLVIIYFNPGIATWLPRAIGW